MSRKIIPRAKCEEDIVTKIARSSADKKIKKYKKLGILPYALPCVSLVIAVVAVILLLLKVEPIYSTLIKNWSIAAWFLTTIVVTAPTAISSLLKYLSSPERHAHLVEKYLIEYKKNLQ